MIRIISSFAHKMGLHCQYVFISEYFELASSAAALYPYPHLLRDNAG
jgi:hypothetical protein